MPSDLFRLCRIHMLQQPPLGKGSARFWRHTAGWLLWVLKKRSSWPPCLRTYAAKKRSFIDAEMPWRCLRDAETLKDAKYNDEHSVAGKEAYTYFLELAKKSRLP
eukprot:scaffold253591_cov20-Prasinocladus_malaysianus.AAC.1